eukprot:TRINITY_DN3162_c0_g1_i2.p10 TRINITY_DN3162_c0_g1~~TRINITY_DN3162_c0_g1_i2.p10  ORF type:complete len:107 (-),score=26.49 TRINITY_DN3162_c0_g1_i2:1566-1886(-)
MEIHEMNDKEANEYALGVRLFPKRDKVNLKEACVSALILSFKSHIGQQIKTVVIDARCGVTGVKTPAKRQRKKNGAVVAAKWRAKNTLGASERDKTTDHCSSPKRD